METVGRSAVDESLLRRFVEEDAVVRAFVRAHTRGHRETDDVIQEIWRVVCAKIAQYDDQRPFRGWVLGIARLQVLKWRQSLGRSREVLSPDVSDLLVEAAETHQDELQLRSQYLRECLARLSVVGRRILQMKYDEGLRIEDIGVRLKRSTAAIEMALTRLRRALRACIEDKLRAGGASAA